MYSQLPIVLNHRQFDTLNPTKKNQNNHLKIEKKNPQKFEIFRIFLKIEIVISSELLKQTL